MEIRNDVDKDVAEATDNRLVKAADCARRAFGHLLDAWGALGDVSDDLPSEVTDRAEAMSKKIEELGKDLRKLARDWTAECIRIEDAINAYDKERERRGA